MTATRKDIELWLRQARDSGAAYLIVGLDPMDYDNFPIFCESGKECDAAMRRLLESGNRFDEVYDLSLPLDPQIAEHRAMHLPPKT